MKTEVVLASAGRKVGGGEPPRQGTRVKGLGGNRREVKGVSV